MAADVARGTMLKRVAGLIVIAGAVLFAVQGGEFTTLDLFRQKRRITRLTRTVDSLQRVDSALRVYDDKVEHDPATQERIAREVFGMVRGNKEILYRFTSPAAGGADSGSKHPRTP